jgi:hypothetical protein
MKNGFTIKIKAKKPRGILARPGMTMRSKKTYVRNKKVDEA